MTERLTNVTFDLGRNWAGNIPVNRPDHPNNTLFFWAFEKENGSLTAAAGERNDEPWGIYTNGLVSCIMLPWMTTTNGISATARVPRACLVLRWTYVVPQSSYVYYAWTYPAR